MDANGHDNVDRWVEDKRKYKAIRGWLFIKETEPDRLAIVAHSVVGFPNGGRMDITPAARPLDFPFLRHWDDTVAFDAIKACHRLGVVRDYADGRITVEPMP